MAVRGISRSGSRVGESVARSRNPLSVMRQIVVVKLFIH